MLLARKGKATINLLVVFAIVFVGGPQSQVVTKKLHDQSRILVRFFVECVEFGNRIIKGLQWKKLES